jgi:cytochrome c oxidase subunit 4
VSTTDSTAHAAAHGHASRARQYLLVFFALFVLTVLEVAVSYVPGHRNEIVLVLFALALVKAAFVALFFMHLRWESRVLRLSVAIPLSLPILYAVVLISEAAWRRYVG